MPNSVRRRVPRWVAVAVPLIFCAGALGCAVFYWPWITRLRVELRGPLPRTLEGGSHVSDRTDFEDRFPGHTEVAITDRFGAPAERLAGAASGPFQFDRREYPEAHVVRYAGTGGQLHLAYCRQRGKWVCFRAHWRSDSPSD